MKSDPSAISNADMITLPADEVASILADVRRFAGPPLHTLDVVQARAGLEERRRARPSYHCGEVEIRDELSVIGSRTIPLRHYRPRDAWGGGHIIYCHGGGWVLGRPSDFDAVCARLAAKTGCALVSPDYRLAPENPYPAALNDILTVIEAIAKIGTVALIGESAGANLALAAALSSTGLRRTPVCIGLFYPVLEPIPASVVRHTGLDTPFLSAADLDWCWRHYLGAAGITDDRAMPGRCRELAGLPSTLIVHGSADPTMPTTRAFVTRARGAGRDIAERCYGGLPHAFTGLLQHAAVAGIVDEMASWLKSHLNRADRI